MTDDFNKWWDEDVLTEDNPFNGGTPAYWAWEGWCAAVKAEREQCAKLCDGLADMHAKMNQWGSHKTADTLAQAIRAGAKHE